MKWLDDLKNFRVDLMTLYFDLGVVNNELEQARMKIEDQHRVFVDAAEAGELIDLGVVGERIRKFESLKSKIFEFHNQVEFAFIHHQDKMPDNEISSLKVSIRRFSDEIRLI